MLRIGEFSRLSQVTVKTLHHYDEIGLFRPSQIDRFTGYRYYTIDQLSRIHSIMALKELGLSLEEIAQLLRDDLPAEQIRGMLRLKQTQVQQRIREEQAQLAQIDFRLRQIELEGTVKTLEVVIKKIEPHWAMTLRREYHSRAERMVVGQALAKAGKMGLVKWADQSPTDIYYEEEFRGDYTDTEHTIPVEPMHPPVVELPDGVGTLTLRQLPGIEAAATYLHQGDYDTLPEKYLLLQRWVVENGYKLSGTWRLVFHRGPMHADDPSEYLTELQHPIERA